MPKPRYRSALEVGCSIGVLTRSLASRCDAVVAIDAAEAPLVEARRRCADLPGVRFEQMFVPDEWPDGEFELILLSEVVYYLSRHDVGRLAARVTRSLAKDGSVILVHWTGETNYPLSGDEARRPLHRRGRIVMRRRARGSISAISLGRAVAVGELSSRRRASQRRAIDICPGNSAGLSNRRANSGLRSSMRAQAAPNVDSWMMSLISRAGISSLAAQSLIESKASRAVQSPQAPTPRSARERRAERLQGVVAKSLGLPASDRKGCQRRRPARAPASDLT